MPPARSESARQGSAAARLPLVPLPAIHAGFRPAITRRQSPPSLLPRLPALAASECGLWLGARDPEARRHYWKGHGVTLVGEGLQQSRRDLFPAPVGLDGRAGGLAQCLTLSLGQPEQAAELDCEIPGVAGLEARQPALLGRILRLETLSDLRE